MKRDKHKTLKNKADKLFQELGRQVYDKCYVKGCKEPYSCLHHFIHKSQSNALRWDLWNGIPVCHKHHCKIHAKNDPIDILDITMWARERFNWDIINTHGYSWEEYIRDKKNEVFKERIFVLEEVIEQLKGRMLYGNVKADIREV
jgi:hypothetical protein